MWKQFIERLWILNATGTGGKHSGRVSGIHSVRPVRWHDASVEILQLSVPGLHKILPEARDD